MRGFSYGIPPEYSHHSPWPQVASDYVIFDGVFKFRTAKWRGLICDSSQGKGDEDSFIHTESRCDIHAVHGPDRAGICAGRPGWWWLRGRWLSRGRLWGRWL